MTREAFGPAGLTKTGINHMIIVYYPGKAVYNTMREITINTGQLLFSEKIISEARIMKI